MGVRVVHAGDGELVIAVAGAARQPADIIHLSLAYELRVPGADELAGIALEDNDVLGPDADCLQVADNLEQQFRAGNRAYDIRPLAVAPDRVDLHPDHFTRREERAPRFERVVGAGELAHPAIQHLPHDGAIDPVPVVHRVRIVNLYHPPTIGAGHAVGLSGLTVRGGVRVCQTPVVDGLASNDSERDTGDSQTGG